ncbi:hypothetical protein GWI33_021534 [Rhynchophorus ferrugineus]|uniref:Uncharacterized protein n=1 Tax=Rhynchophorus ferrugineus TaxID=354439 RepID=A0A834M2E2_RHYFE|nr:hypothetical protein GWI33_021534 [Rhynchophorus ferrugineus]
MNKQYLRKLIAKSPSRGNELGSLGTQVESPRFARPMLRSERVVTTVSHYPKVRFLFDGTHHLLNGVCTGGTNVESTAFNSDQLYYSFVLKVCQNLHNKFVQSLKNIKRHGGIDRQASKVPRGMKDRERERPWVVPCTVIRQPPLNPPTLHPSPRPPAVPHPSRRPIKSKTVVDASPPTLALSVRFVRAYICFSSPLSSVITRRSQPGGLGEPRRPPGPYAAIFKGVHNGGLCVDGELSDDGIADKVLIRY